MTLLQTIQQLQFTDKPQAEALLLDFINQTFPELDVVTCDLRPQAISLNSFNGFITLATGKKLFFKTHTEEDNQIDEYYNAQMLEAAGYPIIKPIYSSTQAGQHLLIYEVIESPSVFDLAWEIEQMGGDFTALQAAQNREDAALFERYTHTLAFQSSRDAAKAPIHQLFWHRITGGRLTRFYNGQTITLPDGATCTTDDLFNATWIINGQRYEQTIYDIIEQAKHLLNPNQSGISIIGHGDAHNGNVFFTGDLLYFDPAFAGRHHPLLDLAKPLFHNVFAMWIYYPKIKQQHTNITYHFEAGVMNVVHDYHLPEIRHMFLRSKVEHTLIPIVTYLFERSDLRADWRTYLKSALFCCPFLTLNLADHTRFPPAITLLGLAMSVEMGAESKDIRSLIDRTLDEVII
ncbi:MAG: hypothetical protein CUN56_07520 [Phototrophicales bacterium]|nr:MAG: hypothetical protein CUN56_07520 [Phototrophicales bacterium]